MMQSESVCKEARAVISKERPAAFMDAVLAVVMTRLVLELAHPATASIEGFLALKHEHFAYAVSLFWLGSMWVSITTERDAIERVDRHVPWHMIVLPFFSSPIPYATILVSEDFGSVAYQSFYGIIVMALTFANLRLGRAAEQANAGIEKVDTAQMHRRQRLLAIDCPTKAIGLLICISVWPPAMAIAVAVAAAFITIGVHLPQQEDA